MLHDMLKLRQRDSLATRNIVKVGKLGPDALDIMFAQPIHHVVLAAAEMLRPFAPC